MFTDFLELMRVYGLKVSITEWITLHRAMEQNLHDSSLTGFYHLCRSITVHSEKDYDRFDQAFLEYFKNGEHIPGHEKLMKFLDNPIERKREQQISNEEARETTLTVEQIEEKYQERLKKQNMEHNGGKRAIGTMGFTAYGNKGQAKGGIRVGGKSTRLTAFQVASRRKYRDWRNDNVLDSRQFQMAFRSLRQLTDNTQADKTELDIDKTIRKTCDHAGLLHVEMKSPRKNNVKLMMLIDTGGSMDPYQKLCAVLFQSAKKAGSFADLKIYYFHNFIGRYLYPTPEIRLEERIDTDQILRDTPSNYRILIIGDGQMSDVELLRKSLWMNERSVPQQKSGFDWFMDFRKKYDHCVWLHPQAAPPVNGVLSRSNHILKDAFPMYRLTLDGLNAGMKTLLVNH
jgi:uncharacterized protein with von Willebrand factor type A (vWA) domain